jgi:hypothetical protein
MLRKLALTLAASVALGAAALSPTAASAGWKGGWGHHHHHGFGFGFGPIVVGSGYVEDDCYVTRRVRTPYGYRLRTVNVCY